MKTALLVIDMQNFFAEMVSPLTLSHITTLVSYFRKTKQPVIFTQHGHTDEELSARSFRNQLVRKWGPDGSIRVRTPDWEFIPEIQKLVDGSKEKKSVVIPKNTYDAFLGTRLEEVLKEEAVERVVVCGVMTDCCCDTTARGAFNRGYETWLVEDACGSANLAQHRAGLRAFGFAFGDVVSTGELLARLRGE